MMKNEVLILFTFTFTMLGFRVSAPLINKLKTVFLKRIGISFFINIKQSSR